MVRGTVENCGLCRSDFVMGANVSFELCTLERKGQISGLFAVLGLSSGSFVNCLKTIIVKFERA